MIRVVRHFSSGEWPRISLLVACHKNWKSFTKITRLAKNIGRHIRGRPAVKTVTGELTQINLGDEEEKANSTIANDAFRRVP